MLGYPRLVIIATLIAAGLLAGPAVPAAASCAGPPSPSQNAFTGTVLSTERDGLVARVRTPSGPTVTVRGTPSETGVTSVDRTYRVGARYEFHPINSSDPYEDNVCTATRQLVGADGGAGGNPRGPDPSPATQTGGYAGYLAMASVVLAVAVAALLAASGLRRRRYAVRTRASTQPRSFPGQT